MILGPNGTGKSTLVSAILIGMGGDFQKIGRAKHLKDYIKHGQTSAAIEITLYQNEERETITFLRNIHTSGKSDYRLNNRRVDQDRYMTSVRRFNIQVDNLCQFLPQDRVQDFALMNPHEILKNTQMSVLPPEVGKQFDKLLEFETFSKSVHQKTAQLQDQITSEEATNERLKPVVERMQQRNVIQERLKVANMKQKWLQKDQLEGELTTQRQDMAEQERIIRERANALKPIQEAAGRVLKVRAQDQKAIEEGKKKADMGKVNLRQLQNRANEAEGQLDDCANEFLSLVQEIETRKDQRRRLDVDHMRAEKELLAAEKEYQEEQGRFQGNGQQQQKEMHETKKRKHQTLERRNELCERMDSSMKPKLVAMEHRLHSMRGQADQRVESLRDFDENAYRAVLWLREHYEETMFEGRVYEPMLLELNVRKKEHVMYFENTISKNDLMAFTCEYTSDTVTLHRLLNQQGLRCNVVFSPPTDRVMHQPQTPISRLQPLGLHSYLLSLVDAPIPILNYICKMYNVHNIPVGDASAMRNIARIQEEVNSGIIYLGTTRMFTKKSAYSTDVVRGTDAIQSRNWLVVGVDESVIEEHEREVKKLKADIDKMRNQRTELESELQYLEQKEAEWKQAEGALKNKLNKVKQKKTQLTNVKVKITHLQSLPSCKCCAFVIPTTPF